VARGIAGLGSAAPALTLGAIAAASLACIFAFLQPLDSGVEAVLSIDLGDVDPTFAILSAFGLGALSIGLLRAKHGAWWLAVATLVAALFARPDALQHPLRMVVVGGVLAVLLADRHRYSVKSDADWRRMIAALLLVVAVATGIETSLVIAVTGSWPAPLAALSYATAAVGNAFGISDDAAGQLLRGTSLDALLMLLLLAARLPMVLAALGVLARIPEPPTDPSIRARAHGIGARFGCGALLPFQLADDKLVFSPPETDGMIVYGLVGRTAVVLGDPIGPPEQAPRVLAAFLSRCRREDQIPVVYQASSSGRGALIGAGFRLFRVGQEALVELGDFDLEGPRRANLRHTVTRCRKAGVSIRWFASGIEAALYPELSGELERVDAEWRARVGPELGFTISHFDRTSLSRKPVSVALDEQGHALGFTTYQPTGIDGGWVLDLMRRAPSSPPGVVESCIVQAATVFRAGGSTTLSLGLTPLAGLDPKGPLEERLLAFGARLVRSRYDVAGLTFFKAKFDPVWVPRYGAIRRRSDLAGYVVALLRVHIKMKSLLRRRLRQSAIYVGQ
jgi:phosphatidylglycerol lysyltransferase